MKRPMIAAAFCLAAASALGTRTELLNGVWPAVWIVIAGGAVILSSLHRYFRKMLPWVVLAALSCLYVTGYQRLLSKPVEALARDNSYAVRAVVLDFPDEYEENQRLSLRITEIGKDVPGDTKTRAFRTLCYLPLMQDPPEPGDVLETRLQFYRPDVRDGFERQSYYAANGCFIFARHVEEEPVRFEHRKPVWWSYPLRLAQSMKAVIREQLPERQAGLLNAVLFGDRSGLGTADSQNLRKAGLSHLVAVSGMHVGFLTMFLCIVFGRKFGSFLSIFAILCFIPMAGASPSVIRAAIMYILMAVSFLCFQEVEALNSLAIALVVLLLQNPFAISSASLLLSFGATLGLLLFSGRLQARLMQPFRGWNWYLQQPFRAVASAISCSLCSMIFTTPVLLAMFGYVTVLAPLANLLTLAVVSVLFMLGIPLAVCGLLWPTVPAWLISIESALLTYVLDVGGWISGLPLGVLSWGDLIGKIAVFVLYIGLLLMLLPKRNRVLLILPPFCAVLTVFSFVSLRMERESTRLSILPCGAGQTLIYSNGAEALTVIDCGGDKGHDSAEAVVEYLDWNGLETIDTLILTAVDKAHARYAPALLETGRVQSLLLPEIPETRQKELYTELLNAADENGVPYEIGISSDLPEGLKLWDEIERKFVAEIRLGDQTVLTVHSLTQKMLAEFLDAVPVKADILLLSESSIEDPDRLRAAFEVIEPAELVLECGYIDNESLLRRPCHNTKLEGEIVLAEGKGGAVTWR